MNTESLDNLLALAAEQKTALEAENERLRAELDRLKSTYSDHKYVDLNSHIEVIGENEYIPYLVAKNMLADARAELAAHIAWERRAYAYFRDSIALNAADWEEINRLGSVRFDLESTAPAEVRQPAEGEAT